MPRLARAALCAIAMATAIASPAEAHGGDPRYRSVFDAVRPAVSGLHVQVLGYDNQLELVNRTGRPVTILGYQDEPYARVLPDGAVQLNERSPATFLNEERFGDAPVPTSADPKAPPQWRTVDRTNRFIWHDHRMHWMTRTLPPQVRDRHRKTKIFDYRIPVQVGAGRASIAGTLYWLGESRGVPMPMWLALGALVLLSAALSVRVRRRRDSAAHGRTTGPEPRPTPEAW